MTVAQYFAEIVGKPLKFPELPCIKTGNEKRPVYLPLEFVNMEPNQSTGKLSQQEQLVMVGRPALRCGREQPPASLVEQRGRVRKREILDEHAFEPPVPREVGSIASV